MFKNACFIKPNIEFDKNNLTYAPMFRKKFIIEQKEIKSAILSVCGLGYGYYYLNGKAVSEDLFTAPVSDYRKTLWYNCYDVTDKLLDGENVFAVMCGNGWYNEAIVTPWNFENAEWRDMPKFILNLEINGETIVSTDETWCCTLNSPVTLNQLRQGEHFDARKYRKDWKNIDFDDSSWELAKKDNCPPKGIFRECLCEPVRETEELMPLSYNCIGKNCYIFNFGQNISGYARIKVKQNSGDKIKLRYAEDINDDGTLQLENMQIHIYRENGIFQTDEFICGDEIIEWSPKFTYHGFRYIEVSGLKNVENISIKAIAVHQAVKKRSSFKCSNPLLNTLFEIGQKATLFNMCYMPTDCPTREKMGWLNDVQSSAEQFMTNFELEKLLSKWWIDICDAMKPTGALPGIVPTSGWSYDDEFNGPVSEGSLFEIPYQIYLHTGDDTLLRKGIPYFKKSITYWNSRKDENGDISYGLPDHAGPYPDENRVSAKFINPILKIKCLRILLLATKICGEDTSRIEAEIDTDIKRIKKIWINSEGRCIEHRQTTVSMLICHDIYDDLQPLSKQLKQLVEEFDFHHECGMVGLPCLYRALNKCNLQEYAYKILTAKGFPSYSDWVEDGATTLYERWNMKTSKNHHMYSDFMTWMTSTILGVHADIAHPAYKRIKITPHFLKDLSFAEGYFDTVSGRITVKWEKNGDIVDLSIEIPSDIEAYYQSKKLSCGMNKFSVHYKNEI